MNSQGETVASAESSLAVSANNLLQVASPASMADVTGYNVYVSTSTGIETKQNTTAIALGTAWTEPTSGLISGAALPATNTTFYPGSASTNWLHGIRFAPNGSKHPTNWLSINKTVDQMFLMEDCQVATSDGDAIAINQGWVNAHLRRLRFDNVGGYAIRATAVSTQFYSSFSLTDFTVATSGVTPPGFFIIDNTLGSTNTGPISFQNARMENNTGFSGTNLAVFTLVGSGIQLHLIDLAYQNIANQAGQAWFYANLGTPPADIAMDNCYGPGTLFNGNWGATTQFISTSDKSNKFVRLFRRGTMSGLTLQSCSICAGSEEGLDLFDTSSGDTAAHKYVRTASNGNFRIYSSDLSRAMVDIPDAAALAPLNGHVVASAAITPSSVSATTCAEQSFTPAAFSSITTSDVVTANFSPAPTSLAFPVNVRAVSGGIAVTYCNPTAGALTPTAVTASVSTWR